MNEHALGAMELRFAELIWAHAPVASGELVRLCAATLGWKKSTTYTMLRRLCQRSLFQNDGGTVSARMSEAEFRAMQCERFVSDAFDGSLPQFVAAFTSRRPLRADEVEELKRMIADCEVRA